MDIDTSVPAVILNTYTHCGVTLIRSLGRLGIPVYAVHETRAAPSLRSRYCREAFGLSLVESPPELAVDALLQLAKRIGGRPLLIPTEDVSCLFVEDHADDLRSGFRFAQRPPGLARALSSKKEMYMLCRRFGVATPEAAFPKSRDEVVQFAESARFPLMVKAVDNRDVHGLPGAGKAVTTCPEDLLEAVDRLSGDGPMPELVLQEHIPNGTVWMFNGYFDGNSECLFGITARKLRTYPAYVGQTSLGICAANEAVADTTRHFMHALGYTGVLDIGYIYDRRDGQHKLLDVNPRIGSTFRLFLAENGLDVARALYLDMTGQAVPRGEAIDQRKWLVENYDLAASIGYWREGDLRFRDWLSSLSGIEESAWLAADDPSPFGAMWAASVRYLLRTSLDRHERLGWLKMNGAPTL